MPNIATRETYTYYWNRFLEETKGTKDEVIALGTSNPKKLENHIIAYLFQYRKQCEKGELSPSTVSGFYKAIKKHLKSKVTLNWEHIVETLPKPNRGGSDRAIEISEIRALLKMADVRAKALILLLAASGIRIGAAPGLNVGHLKPFKEKGKVIAAMVKVYVGTNEEYTTFITGEVWDAIETYLTHRRKHREHITEKSPLFRDIWKKNANVVKRVERDALRSVMHRVIRDSGIRGELKGKRHEFQTDHAFRKFFKTRTEQVMKPINIEIMLGHSTGISGRYYRPKESELLEDYKKAIPLLSISQQVEQIDKGQDYQKMKHLLKFQIHAYTGHGGQPSKDCEICSKAMKEFSSMSLEQDEELDLRLIE